MKTKPKYIQDTDWWKESLAEVGRELNERCRKRIDKIIIEAFTVPLQAPESPVSG